MAASKNKKTGHSGRNTKKATAMEQEVGRFQTEIIVFVILAACVILMASNFGAGGFVGDAISNFCFGLMGLMAYLFPIVFFIGAAFILINKTNRLAYKKLAAAFVMFLFLCGAAQLLTDGYMQSTTLMDYYALSADYKTGGGLIGGAICISITSAFGTVGGYVIIILAFVVCMIIITQHSLLDFVTLLVIKICDFVKDGRTRYVQGQPEREMRREKRARERQLMREQRREEKIRRLEDEIGDDEFSDDDDFLLDPSEAKKMKKGGFLEGTKLTGYSEEKPKKKDKLLKKKTDTAKMTAKTEENIDDSGDTDNTNEESADNTGKKQEETDGKYAGTPMNFEIHRAEDTVTDTYEADSEPQQEEEEELLPFPEEKVTRQPSKNPKSSEKEIQSGIVNIQHEITRQEAAVKKEYKFPTLNLLKKGSNKSQGDSDAYLRKTAQKLQEVLHNFGVNVTVTNVSCGPTVTRYELQPEMGVKVSKIVGLADDIKLNLATPDIRIEAPIPGKAAVGIEVPNKENSTVMLRDLLQSEEFQKAKSKLSFAVGKDIAGKTVVADIARMPHLLIAGATGSGKSVCINTLIISILYKANPDEVKLIMIDPKVVELSVYNGIPHLFIPVVTDPKKAAGALNWAVQEMTNRYNTFAEYGVRNLNEYNKKAEQIREAGGAEEEPVKMPQIIIIVDELADLMMVAPGEVEDAICRLAQLARAAGIHLIIATQRPSVNVITGLIKANMPSRIAFSVSSGVDSRTILDMNGAEKLLGKGDMLFYPQGYQKPARLQGAFVSDDEVSAVVEFLADKNPGAQYNQQIEQQVNSPVTAVGTSGDDRDVHFEEAGKFIIEKEKASIGMLQRMFKIGFNRAARIMDQLCDAGVVGPEEGTKPRKVLMSMEEFQDYLENQ
ncbi:FtsK/SpoIIIE family DNA translocase [Blautia wexlerae]|uniref:FtsK/SpoIIIE family DNA translocase n=1 Tax=Blautia wexlerae TaxID=418240 RepID=UPI001570E104|nr:DNA translocase FtsK [Blautia wexlerae]